MTPEERQLLLMTAKEIARFSRERDDMIVGITVAILDLYRADFNAGRQTKEEVITRLRVQLDELEQKSPNRMGTAMLDSLIQTLEAGQLDAAKLIREPSAGTA